MNKEIKLNILWYFLLLVICYFKRLKLQNQHMKRQCKMQLKNETKQENAAKSNKKSTC